MDYFGIYSAAFSDASGARFGGLFLRSQGVWMLDLQGNTSYANSYLCDWLGVTPEEIADAP